MSTKQFAGSSGFENIRRNSRSATPAPITATSFSMASSVASSPSARASSNSSPPSAIDVASVLSVPTTPSRSLRSRPSSCARLGSSQTFGSSSARATSVSRTAFASKSKIPPQLVRPRLEIGKRCGDLVDAFGFHGGTSSGQTEIIADRTVFPVPRRVELGRDSGFAYDVHTRTGARSRPLPTVRPGATMATFLVNTKRVDVPASVPGDTPLLWVLRDHLNLTGTKYGCGMALCGACTVYVEGEPTRSCQVPLSSIKAGAAITTIEGLRTREARAVQAAWEKLDVPQCGYCQSGQVMAAAALLAKKKKPTDADIDAAMSGNLCRCATYVRIRAAIHEAAKSLA